MRGAISSETNGKGAEGSKEEIPVNFENYVQISKYKMGFIRFDPL